MSISTESTEGGSARPAPDSAPAAGGGSLMTGAAGDRCPVCNAKLAIDQRYCVECGTRRGNPRFTLAQPEPEAASGSRNAGQLASAALRRAQILLAVLVVLVAIGVGILIGDGTAKTPQVKVIGGSGATTVKSGSGSSGSSSSGSKSSSGGSAGNLFKSGS